jgi:hypothetical protein
MKRITSTLLILLLSQLNATANEASADNTSVKKVDSGATKLSPRLSLNSTIVSNRRDINDDPDALLYNSTKFGVSLRSNKKYSMSFGIGFNKNLTGERKLDWGDGSFALSRGLARPSKYMNISGKVSTIIPLAKTTKAYSELNGLVGIQPVISWDASQIGANGLSLAYIPRFTAYFHEHETNVNGTSNNQYKLGHVLSVDYSFTDKFSVNVTGIYNTKWTYGGYRGADFAMDQSISYSFNKTIWTSFGHSIGGAALAPNGRSNSFEFYDENLSTWYLSAGLNF